MRKLWTASMRSAALVVLAAVGGALLLASGGDQEVHWSRGLMVVVDAYLPTSIYASGVPQTGDVDAVGDSLRIVSWPAEAGAPHPEHARVAGRVAWSVADRPDAARWHAVDDTLGWLVLLEPSTPDDPHRLRAELRPEYRPQSRIAR